MNSMEKKRREIERDPLGYLIRQSIVVMDRHLRKKKAEAAEREKAKGERCLKSA